MNENRTDPSGASIRDCDIGGKSHRRQAALALGALRPAIACTLLAQIACLGPLGCFTCPNPALTDDAPANYDSAVDALLNDPPLIELEPGLADNDIAAGLCEDASIRFIYHWTSAFSWQWDFFDSETGAFVGRETGVGELGPVIPLPLCVFEFWPRLVDCRDLVVTDVLMGTRYSVGDTSDVFPIRE